MEPEWCSGLLEHRRLAGLCGYGLVNTDSCSSQPQPWPTWQVAPDMPLNTPTAGATVRNRSIPQGRKTSMSNQRESAPRVMFFRPDPAPLPSSSQTSRSPSQDCSWGCLMTLSYPFKAGAAKRCCWCIILAVTCSEDRHVHEINRGTGIL